LPAPFSKFVLKYFIPLFRFSNTMQTKAGDLYRIERRNQLISYGTTFLVHALILLLLWWAVMFPPNPPWEEMGGGGSEIAMSFGDPNMGGPDLIPVETDISPALPPEPDPPTDQATNLTQDVEDAPAIDAPVEKPKETEVKKKIEKLLEPKKEPVKKPEPVEKPRQVDQNALFKKKGATGVSKGSGNGDIPGNEGRTDGDPAGSPGGGDGSNGTGGSGDGTGTGNGTGSGSGNGAGNGSGDGFGDYDLKGRSLSRRPDVSDNSRETGRVVVQIVVDRNGKVIKAIPGYKGTTTLNSSLLEKAKRGALDARFSPKPDGPEEQFGTMTFVFRFRQ
jgi:outer membrane biosynthesis protein TonB